MKYPCVESTFEVYRVWGTVRLWIDRDECVLPAFDGDLVATIDAIAAQTIAGGWNVAAFVDACVAEIPRLSAIQVISSLEVDRVRRGVVVYVTDFNVEKDG